MIASLNCVSHTGWVDDAHGLQEAGVDAIELNIYFIPADLAMTGREVEQHYLDILAAVKVSVSIPVAVKIGPYFSAPGAMAHALAASTGVESADEVFKYLLASADTVMTTASLLRHGVEHMRTLLDGLSALLASREIDSVNDIHGRMSQKNLMHPTAFERANYVHILQGYHAGVTDGPGR